jgi:acyl-CoA thioesterase
MTFDDATALTPAEDGAFDGAIADGWNTPVGPLGGYVMAIVLRGMQAAVADDARQPRSFTVHFLRPPHPGPVTVRPTVVRTGRTLTSVTARLEQDGKLIALAVGAFSTPWESPLLEDAPMPEVEPADPSRPPARLVARTETPEPPPFTEKVTLQWRFGEPPFSGAAHAEIGGWLALREHRPVDALALCVLADAWFPAPWPRLKALVPAPTVDLTIHFRAPPLDDAPLLGRFRTRVVRDGFFDEDGELWAADGTLVAQSRQLGLLIGAQS